jgi:hypothetical protein
MFTSLLNSCVEELTLTVMASGRGALRDDQICLLDGISTLAHEISEIAWPSPWRVGENRDICQEGSLPERYGHTFTWAFLVSRMVNTNFSFINHPSMVLLLHQPTSWTEINAPESLWASSQMH